MLFRRFVLFALFTATSLLSAQQSAISGHMLDPQGHPVATSDKAYPPQLSGTVVDTSGAVIAGAAVHIRERERHCTKNGTFGQEWLLHFFWTRGRQLSARRNRIPVLKPKKSWSPSGPPGRRPRCASLWSWAP